jgi:hypothetical protein
VHVGERRRAASGLLRLRRLQRIETEAALLGPSSASAGIAP